jgi:hypothetical protein
MANDPSKKTLRHFYCRDVLWQSFERMSESLDRGVDDLVNEAMRLLARQQGFLPADYPSSAGDLTPPNPAGNSVPPPRPRPDATPTGAPGAPPARPGSGSFTDLRRASSVPPPLPSGRGTSEHPSMRPPPPPGFAMPPSGGLKPAPPLYLIFGNQKYSVDKDQFIIGRGTKSADLPIRDGNISRKHAAVIRRNGDYYIKDLGSTNGIDYNGDRIEGKKIEEGDVFSICDYQLRFTFK